MRPQVLLVPNASIHLVAPALGPETTLEGESRRLPLPWSRTPKKEGRKGSPRCSRPSPPPCNEVLPGQREASYAGKPVFRNLSGVGGEGRGEHAHSSAAV